MDGYRMKFACYFPRVDYGQSSRLGPGPDPEPPSGSPWLCLLLSGHGQPFCSALTYSPLSLGLTNLPSLLLNPHRLPG